MSPCACFQILSRIILSQSCLSAEHVFRERINRNLIALLGGVCDRGKLWGSTSQWCGFGFFFSCCWNEFLSVHVICVGTLLCKSSDTVLTICSVCHRQNVVFTERKCTFQSSIMETVISDGISPLIPHFHPRRTSRLTDNLAVQAPVQNLRVKQRLLKHKYDLISPPDEFFVCGLAAVPARADILTSRQEIQPDLWALQLKQKQLLTPALLLLLRWCHPLA